MSARKAYIYKIVNPKGKIYVGSTVNLKARISKYRNASCPAQRKLFNSLKKYGFQKHRFEVICECTTDDIFKQESYYGILYNVLSVNGLNLALPKHGDTYQSMSEETLKKKSELMTGRKISDETREKLKLRVCSPEARRNMSIAQTGLKRSPEAIAKSVLGRQGKKCSVEICARMSLARKGTPMPPLALVRAYEKTGKKVINIETGEVYRSLEMAAKTIGKVGSALSVYLNGKRPNKTPFRFVSEADHCSRVAV